jgi:hypothetical protein
MPMASDVIESISEALEERYNPGITKTVEYRVSKARRKRCEQISALIVGATIAVVLATLTFIYPRGDSCFYIIPWCFSALCVFIALFENWQHVEQFKEEEVRLVFEL